MGNDAGPVRGWISQLRRQVILSVRVSDLVAYDGIGG